MKKSKPRWAIANHKRSAAVSKRHTRNKCCRAAGCRACDDVLADAASDCVENSVRRQQHAGDSSQLPNLAPSVAASLSVMTLRWKLESDARLCRDDFELNQGLL